MKITAVNTKTTEIKSAGNWWGPKDIFPAIEVDQATGTVTVEFFDVADSKRAWGKTHEHTEDLSADGTALFVRGMTGVKNVKHPECGGRQQFCYAIFEGDSGHIYVHRAVASKGWMAASPAEIRKRLRKLGIGADAGVVQQGDFLLKPANGSSLPDEEFKHEYMGSGHHKFELPVLRSGGQIWVQEPTNLVHHAVDGIQHPTVTVQPGKYIVGTTAPSLEHSNKRD